MCGIVGVSGWGDRSCLEFMTDLLAHRGPNDRGIWDTVLPDGTWIGLGNRRLSIIDLSPAGHMPMVNHDNTLCITYNGEIYNFPDLRRELISKGYTFRSHTDTEVVLNLYQEEGPQCVRRLKGMFAFAIYDRRRGGELFLARDHFGIKPLYYVWKESRFAFASEIKSLLQLPGIEATVDMNALDQYLTFLWVPDPKTMFESIEKVPAGHYAIFKEGQLTLTCYWDLTYPSGDTRLARSEEELTEAIRDRFRKSVRSQLISDVPIGAFLSAGLDSSSIVAFMAENGGSRFPTYTVTFPEKYRLGEKTLDDPKVAQLVADRFGCDHHQIVVEPDLEDLLPNLIWHMDEPVADPAIIPAYWVCREASETVPVLLSGIGGDELFAGYRKYLVPKWAPIYQKLPPRVRRHLIEPLVSALPTFRGTPFKGTVRLTKKFVRCAAFPPRESFLMNSTYLDGTHKRELYTPHLLDLLDQNPWKQHEACFEKVADADFLNQMLYLDSKFFMVSLNLTYNDKMSMASSVEVRVPFLDWELAEFAAWEIAPSLKLKGLFLPRTKYIFRKAMEGILPEAVVRQSKAGFGAPVDYWLANDLREMVDDLLSEEQIRRRGFFQPKAIRKLVQEQRRGDQDWSLQIWQFLTLELWLRCFIDNGGRSACS